MKQFGGRLLMTIGIILLALGGITLGVLQYTWINRIAETDRERIRRELERNTVHVISSSLDEVRIIFSLFHTVSIAESAEHESFRKIENNLLYWKENSSYPGLVPEVYGIRKGAAAESYTFTHEGFTPSPLPAHLKQVQNNFLQESRGKDLREVLRELKNSGYAVFGDDRMHGEAMYICKMDMTVFLGDVFSYYIDRYLSEYPYKIVSSGGEVIASSSRGTGFAEEPELSVPLFNFLTMSQNKYPFMPDDPFRKKEELSGKTPDVFDGRQNPLIRFWTDRSRDSEDSVLPEPSRNPIAVLHIYYPNQSLDSVVSARKRANIILSFGILAILIASIIVIYRMYARLQRIQEREQEFVASMSHELRTPITVIKSISQNLSEGIISSKEKVVRYGSIIQEQSNRLAQMVEGILAYSGLSTGKRVTRTDIDFHQFIRDIIDSFLPAAEQAGTEIRYYGDESIGTVRTDSSALRIIVENLLLNALRHGLPNEKHGYKKPYIINVNSARTNPENRTGELSFLVEDHGEGIPQKEAQKIFEPFVRGKQAADSQRPGSGIGLHLVKRVAEMLGGSVELETPYVDRSGVSRTGCRFTVILPLTEEENENG